MPEEHAFGTKPDALRRENHAMPDILIFPWSIVLGRQKRLPAHSGDCSQMPKLFGGEASLVFDDMAVECKI